MCRILFGDTVYENMKRNWLHLIQYVSHVLPTVAVVGLEETLYRMMEGVGTVEVCAIFYQPPAVVACPAPFPFNVSISTRIGTAGTCTFRTSYRKWSNATDFLEESHTYCHNSNIFNQLILNS